MGWGGCEFFYLLGIAGNIKISTEEVMFTNPQTYRVGCQLSKKIFGLELSEMSRPTQEAHVWHHPIREGMEMVH